MSVLINMEMPTRCGRCDMRISAYDDGMFDHYECCITAAIIDNLGEKMEDCPLAPVPKHRRCIDADALFKVIGMDERFSVLEAMYIQSIISSAPTILEAEEGE